MFSIITNTPNELFHLGSYIAKFFLPGDFLALNGDLGAGKTLLCTGIASELQVIEDISSPTFTIIHEYESGRIPFYHFDVYRLNHSDELYDLGYEEYFYGNGVTVVEWANLIDSFLPSDYLSINISVVPEGRKLEFQPFGERGEQLLFDIQKGVDSFENIKY